MSFDDKLKIDPADVKSKIVDFLRSTLEKRDIDGLLILYKNCIESITNVHLAIETVGRHNVKVLVTRGRLFNKQPREKMDLDTINKHLDLPDENIVFANKDGALREIRKIVDKSIEYKFGLGSTLPVVFNYNLSYLLLRDLASSEIEKKTFAPPTKKPLSRREKFIQKSIAHYKSQIRLRVLLAFLLAESENRSFMMNPVWKTGLCFGEGRNQGSRLRSRVRTVRMEQIRRKAQQNTLSFHPPR